MATNDETPSLAITVARWTVVTLASFVVWKVAELTIGERLDQWAASRRRARAVKRAEES